MSDTIKFPTPVLKMTEASPPYHYLPVPPDIAESLIESGTRRVIADLDGFVIRRSLFTHNDNEYAIIVGLRYLKEAGFDIGDTVPLGLCSDPEPDRVDLCEEFQAVLEQDEEAAERFGSFTPGKQRSLAYHVNSAKKSETRIRRALDVAEKLRTHTLYSDLHSD